MKQLSLTVAMFYGMSSMVLCADVPPSDMPVAAVITEVPAAAQQQEAPQSFQKDSFGKTHFIKGYPHQFPLQSTPQPVPMAQSSRSSGSMRTFFSPDDDVRAELLNHIAQEKESIIIATFLLTDNEIAQALVDACKRGVKVEIVADPGCLKERASKINMVCEGGCSVFIYNPAYRKNDTGGLMHHKFVLFGNNNGDKLVATGSYNLTQAANKSNQENILIVQDDETYQRYHQQFGKLKERAHQYGKTKSKDKN